jgi:hypothetical protein
MTRIRRTSSLVVLVVVLALSSAACSRRAEPLAEAPPAKSAAREAEPAAPAAQPSAAVDAGNACTVAVSGDSPVAKACQAGGREAAKKVMKALVKQAKVRGRKYSCDGCHKELDQYELIAGAREDLAALIAFAPEALNAL